MVYLLLIAGVLLFYSSYLAHPKHNWDMIGYVASVYSYLGMEGEELREATYSDVRAAIDEERFGELTGADDDPWDAVSVYHRAVYNDAEALEQHNWYRTRPVYILSVMAVSLFTDTVSTATWIVSNVAGAVSLILLGWLLFRERAAVFYAFPPVLAAATLGSLPRYSTPDMLTAMTAIAIACIGLRAPRAAIWLLPLVPASRMDFILLVPFFALALFSRERRLDVVLSLALCVAVYLALGGYFGNYGYLTSFNFGLLAPHPYPAEMPLSSDIGDYIGAYKAGAVRFLTDLSALIIGAGAVLSVLHLKRAGYKDGGRSIHGFALAAAVFILLHFIVFPVGHYRFYFVATGLCLAVIFSSSDFYARLTRYRPRLTK